MDFGELAVSLKRRLFNGGQVPLGFDQNPKNPGELRVHPTEPKVVRAIFEVIN